MVAAGLRGGAQGSPAHRAERPTSAVGDPSNLIRVIPAKGAAMATASQQPAHLQRPPEWGIQPVPRELRVLGFLDQAVLWGNLGISLLVLVAGALLVPPLGLRGSLLPTACNVVQNLGWATLELLVIAAAASEVSERVLGFGGRLLWVGVFGVLTTVMAVAGPLTVIRRWLKRFAIWAVLASTGYLTWYALTRFDLGR